MVVVVVSELSTSPFELAKKIDDKFQNHRHSRCCYYRLIMVSKNEVLIIRLAVDVMWDKVRPKPSFGRCDQSKKILLPPSFPFDHPGLTFEGCGERNADEMDMCMKQIRLSNMTLLLLLLLLLGAWNRMADEKICKISMLISKSKEGSV